MSDTEQPYRGNRRWRSRGVSAEELRRHNLATVLQELHLGGPRSRSELTALTGLNRSTIGDLISELKDLDLVDQGPGPASTGPGRPSPVVTARPEGAVVVALVIDVDSLAAATIGLGGLMFDCRRVAHVGRNRSPGETVAELADLARTLVAELDKSASIVGVGVGVAGITRRSDGFVHLAPNLGWRDVALTELLRSELPTGAPVLVANEADFGAFGEFRRGVPAGTRHLIYLSGEVGIGAGVVIEGEMLRGLAGYAGEVGHMTINPDGHECRCGSYGCWETEAGEAAFLRRLGFDSNETGLRLMDIVTEQAASGDEATLAAIEEVGRWLGLGISNLVNIFNPELVVLGGLYERLYPHLEPAVTATIKSRTLPPPESIVEIVPSRLGVDAPLVGASEAMFSRFVSDPAAGQLTPPQSFAGAPS